MSYAVEPMRGADLKHAIDWGGPDPYAAIARYLTGEYVAERKIDGCRAQLILLDHRTRFGALSRTGTWGERSASFPQFARIVMPELVGTVLDGEFTAPVLPGYDRPMLNQSTGLFNSGPAAARRWLMYGPSRLTVFDVMAVNGHDCTGLPYDERRALLATITSTMVDRFAGCGVELIEQLPATAAAIDGVLALGGEGVMLKRRAGRYQPGKRSDDWLKVKRYATIDCYLTGGYTPGENSREGTVGAVKVAVMDAAGNNVVIGDVAVKPFWVDEVTAPDGSLREEMTGTVIEVMAQGVNEYGHLRHPHMIRLRPDKSPGQCSDVQLSMMPRV